MIVLIIIIVALIAIILYSFLYQQREKVTGHRPYLEGLLALLENNEDLAMKKLKDTVSIDSSLIDAYIILGDLYRKRGDIPRAIQIHQSLTVRPTLKKHEEKKIYFALVEDSLHANRPNKAVSFLKEILKIDKKDKQAQALILKIHEDMENYGDCINMYEEGRIKPKQEKRHAFYYAAMANKRLKNLPEENVDLEKEAFNLFKKALKILPNSLTALYYLGNYFEQKNDLRKAQEYYLKIIRQHPEHAFLIIPKFEKVYFELGSFEEILPLYEKIFQERPKNFPVGFALANLYEKKNDVESAKDVYRKLSELYPKSILPRLYELQLMTEDKSIKRNIGDIEKKVRRQDYTCNNCRLETQNFSFICPRCHAIESFLPSL